MGKWAFRFGHWPHRIDHLSQFEVAGWMQWPVKGHGSCKVQNTLALLEKYLIIDKGKKPNWIIWKWIISLSRICLLNRRKNNNGLKIFLSPVKYSILLIVFNNTRLIGPQILTTHGSLDCFTKTKNFESIPLWRISLQRSIPLNLWPIESRSPIYDIFISPCTKFDDSTGKGL